MSDELKRDHSRRKQYTGQLVALSIRNGRKSRVKTRGLLNLRQIQERYGVDKRQVYAWAEAELIYAYQVGGRGRTLYSEVEIEAARGGNSTKKQAVLLEGAA